MEVDFFFGPGSRYSYLAAVQIAKIEETTGASVHWRAVHSPELIRRAGCDPFLEATRRGQYLREYRTLDASRWAALLSVPYVEPDFGSLDWHELALWCAAAELTDGGNKFAAAILSSTFSAGEAPVGPIQLAKLAGSLDLSPQCLIREVDRGAAADRLERNVDDALGLGAFGVPTFVVADGNLFWGQDRIPLLMHHLQNAS